MSLFAAVTTFAQTVPNPAISLSVMPHDGAVDAAEVIGAVDAAPELRLPVVENHH
jgi:hypothetical protein